MPKFEEYPDASFLGAEDTLLLFQDSSSAVKQISRKNAKIALKVETIADLTAIDVSKLTTGDQISVAGYYEYGDGGGGIFSFDSTATASDNGGTILAPDSGSGRFFRIYSGSLNVRWFGAKGDGVADDFTAFEQALAALPVVRVHVPASQSAYVIKQGTLTLSDGSVLSGDGRGVSVLSHAISADMFELGDSSSVKNIELVGNGSAYSGSCFVLSASDGRQTIRDVEATGFDGPILDIDVSAGSQMSVYNCTFSRYNAASGTGRYAIVISPSQQLSAVPRKFIQIETNGQCAFDFGGCNNTYVANSFLGDLNYTNDSRAVLVSGCRWANQATCTLRGDHNAIIGCDINPILTLAVAGGGNNADGWVIGPNTYNNGVPIDQSGKSTNLIYHHSVQYTPAITTGGSAASLGNGTIEGSFCRNGNVVEFTINLVVGSTTNLGTGDIRFSLPLTFVVQGLVQYAGLVTCQDVSTLTIYSGNVQVPGAQASSAYCTLLRDTSGSITFNSPVTWATGDTFRITGRYQI